MDIPTQQDGTVMLLIGADNHEVFWTIDKRHGKRGQPYAIKTVLGWSLIRFGTRSSNKNFHINFVRKSDELLQKQVECFWKLDNVPEGICSNTVDHQILLSKLEKLGFKENFYDLLNNYLNDKKQCQQCIFTFAKNVDWRATRIHSRPNFILVICKRPA